MQQIISDNRQHQVQLEISTLSGYGDDRVIADDLTGAVDTAVQFSKQGIPSAVALRNDVDLSTFPGSIKIGAINTVSRHVPRQEAFERVVRTVVKARAAGVSRFYKKIDSTFRGNVGVELEALMQAAQGHQLMLVPAYPKAGRTIRDGNVYVNGTPLHASSFSADPLNPMTESSVSAILARQTGYPVYGVGTAALAGLDMAAERRGAIFLFDAGTDGDLKAIGEALARANKLSFCAGSAGFAELLPRLLPLSRSGPGTAGFSARLLVVNGSLNDVSLGQARYAAAAGVPCFTLEYGGGRSLVDSIVQQLNNTRCALLTCPLPAGRSGENGAVAAELGRTAAAVLTAAPDAGVAVFGGDTAAAVCTACGCDILIPLDEIAPGCTLCSDSAAAGGRVWVLKSGGFGQPDIVDRIRGFLSGD